MHTLAQPWCRRGAHAHLLLSTADTNSVCAAVQQLLMHASLLPAPLAGIFVTDILDAVPIDKYFELFKPSAGGEGGFIRLGLDFVKDPAELSRARGGTPWSSILQLQL